MANELGTGEMLTKVDGSKETNNAGNRNDKLEKDRMKKVDSRACEEEGRNRTQPQRSPSFSEAFRTEHFPEAGRFRNPDPNQLQIWRASTTGRPPPAPPQRFAAAAVQPPRNEQPRFAQQPIRSAAPLRSQEYQNRRSFEKPDRSSEEPETRATASPWQRVRETLPNRMDTRARMNSNTAPFEDRTIISRPPERETMASNNFRRDSISTNAENTYRFKNPVQSARYPEDEDVVARNQVRDARERDTSSSSSLQNENDARKAIPVDFVKPSTLFDPGVRRQSVNQAMEPVPQKVRPSLQAVPEYYDSKADQFGKIQLDEHQQQQQQRLFQKAEIERLPPAPDQNRNYRPPPADRYPLEVRKPGDNFKNGFEVEGRAKYSDDITDERRFQQRVYENVDKKFDLAPERREPKFDVNGTWNEKNENAVKENKVITNKKQTPNGDIKPPSSLPELKRDKSALRTPTKKKSPKSPETGSTISLRDKKKVPMNKVQVGAAPSPNLKVVHSKIGSLENYSHKPGGGKVKIENRKLEWKVQPKIEAKNDKYAPSGGDKKITQVKLQWSAKSKIGSLDNATHRPGGGDKKIETVKLDFKDKAKPKVGSKDNIKHVPGGGIVKKTTDADAKSTSSDIEDQKLDIKAQSKIGSLDNVKHKPGGGDKKIFDDKDYLKQTASANESSKANSVTTSGSQAPETNRDESKDRPIIEIITTDRISKYTKLLEPKKSEIKPQLPPPPPSPSPSPPQSESLKKENIVVEEVENDDHNSVTKSKSAAESNQKSADKVKADNRNELQRANDQLVKKEPPSNDRNQSKTVIKAIPNGQKVSVSEITTNRKKMEEQAVVSPPNSDTQTLVISKSKTDIEIKTEEPPAQCEQLETKFSTAKQETESKSKTAEEVKLSNAKSGAESESKAPQRVQIKPEIVKAKLSNVKPDILEIKPSTSKPETETESSKSKQTSEILFIPNVKSDTELKSNKPDIVEKTSIPSASKCDVTKVQSITEAEPEGKTTAPETIPSTRTPKESQTNIENKPRSVSNSIIDAESSRHSSHANESSTSIIITPVEHELAPNAKTSVPLDLRKTAADTESHV